MMAPSNIDRLQVSQNQGMHLILGVPQGASAKMMRYELQMLPVEHRAKLSRAKLYRKIRRNTKHPLHTTINRRQRNGWTTEIQECHRLASRQLEDPTQLHRDDIAPWEQLPYECRIDTACYSMIKNLPLDTSSSDSSTSHSQRGDCPLYGNDQDYTDPKERQNASSHFTTSGLFESHRTNGASQS